MCNYWSNSFFWNLEQFQVDHSQGHNMPRRHRFAVYLCALVSSGGVLGDLSERLEIAPYDRVHEHAGLFLSVTGRCVNDVGFDNNCTAPVGGGVERRHRPVICEPVVPAHHAEPDDVALVVEDLEALGAAGGGKAGDDVDHPDGADAPIAVDDVAALD